MHSEYASLCWIPFLPLLGSIVAYIAGRKNRDFAGWIATGASFAAFLYTITLVRSLPEDTFYEDKVFSWISMGDLSIDFLLRFDHLTAVMCMVVTGVGSLIHLYSVSYMAEEPSRPRFFSYLNLFMFSMLLLVLGGNLLVLFVGWEGVGLCSYLLIGFWYKNLPYAAAGRKAFVVNRIGDAGFLLGMFLLFKNFHTLDFVQLATAISHHANQEELFTLAAACFFVGATGKSAQIPLFVWLPDAMAGPTPVSALIHAATMVTAGVYMMARMNFLFALAPYTGFIVVVIAVLTAFVAAAIALTQNDIKKVLAYSTVSQLGFMFMAAGVGAYWVAIFHVVTHAFFKACLFLGAGSVIHGCHHEQDMRHMGGLASKMKITALTYGLSTLAIAGIFPFAGFQSKHAILAALEGAHNEFLLPFQSMVVLLATLTAFLTAFYMTRSFVMTFMGEYRGHAHPHESPLPMTVPLMILAALATVGGLWLEGSLEPYLSSVIAVGGHTVGGVGAHGGGHEAAHHAGGIVENIIGSWVGFLGIGLALVFYTTLRHIPGKIYRALPGLSLLSTNKFYVDEIYGFLIVRPLEGLARVLWKSFDQATIDGIVNGTGKVVDVSGDVMSRTQTGQIRQYAFFMFAGTFVIILFYLVR